MIQTRVPRRRLAAAVTAVLAVTAGTALASAPATAATLTAAVAANAPAANAPADAQADVISIPRTTRILSAGPSGFLTTEVTPDLKSIYRWTSTVDGTTTVLPERYNGYKGGGSDTIVTREDTTTYYWLHDMASPGSSPKLIDQRDSRLMWQGVVGRTLVFTARDDTTQTSQVHLVGEGNSRQVTGLPATLRYQNMAAVSDSEVIIRYFTRDAAGTNTFYVAVVDVATASVVEQREILPSGGGSQAAASGGRIAWVDAVTPWATRVMTAERGGDGSSPAVQVADMGNAVRTHVGVLGDWVTYAAPGGAGGTFPSDRYALIAANALDGTTVRLLDHAESTVPAADGSLLVLGGSLDRGEGIYRIALGTDGKPTATLVASTGEPTALGLVATNVPPVVDLDRNEGAKLSWTLSRSEAEGAVTIRHNRTGKSKELTFRAPSTTGPRVVDFSWNGLLSGPGINEFAPSGDYTWEVNARPLNGIGPDLKQTGTFKVTRTAGPHDYTDNSSPDLLARDTSGVLWRDDTVKTGSMTEASSTGRVRIGSGWQIFDRLEAVGDIAGSTTADLVARDKDGVLWLYQGKGDGNFAARTKIGAGWQAYDKITGGSDLNGDGRSDLLATDTAGALWFYKGTGDTVTPFAARVKVGTGGWGGINQFTAVGDIAGSAIGDLVARDTAGVLWLYQGKGDGTFTARTKIGGGWGGFTHLVGIGDADRDGRADLYAVGASGAKFYAGTGDPVAPFKPAAASYLHSPATDLDSVL
ncbi:VCBS repeat-containing protein [Streptomyces sp. P9(2023)]|uniref:VCBS repeat-containing protein n=1 Tax=Streptomyces sp. P9(2023) TaxID=3064394 RepID=UPI0028F3F643|nr:VCBS repeat-containing protein [Streptomyces sp. P9(2023)]MDT9690554.1 VCBS repeat-containing protein [Streptomyces sp. P9(2023)]